MYKKKNISIMSAVLAVVMVLALLLTVLPSSASAVTQAEIDALKQQKKELSDQVSSYQSEIDALKSQKKAEVELKTALDNKLALTNQQIVNLEDQIALHDQLIEQKTLEVEEAQATADAQLQKFRARIRCMEEEGRYNYLEALIGAGSISEFLSLIDDIGAIMESDKQLENSYREAVKNLKAVKAEYESAQAEMKATKAELAVLKDQLQRDVAEANAVIASLQSDISANSATLQQLSEQEDALRSKINSKIDELNAQYQRENPSTDPGSNVGTGNLIWPSYCTYISSRQGPRIHPVTGEYKNHGGTDIGASYGTAIWAADSGVVVDSCDGWNGGWGNYVMIDHQNGTQTLYAHMSSRSVSVGQYVSKGQVIGYVGQSGMATGPHLHYELYVGGSRIDPQSYYPNMYFTYSPTA